MNIISGENFQQLADIYLGYQEDFHYNPVIRNQPEKHLYIQSLNTIYDNPKIIFCYTHRINEFSTKLELLKNNFILITHNSDENIIDNQTIQTILSSIKLLGWYSQNVCIYHPKLHMLPIGIANSMWPHGDPTIFENINFTNYPKTKNVYFTFTIDTNRAKREPCYHALKDKLEWLPLIDPRQNVLRLANYRFCICPEGNGVDTHRLWEALYVKCIPIVVKSPFTDTLLRNNIPVIVLDKWEDFDENRLQYTTIEIEFNNFYEFVKIINK